MKAGTLIVALTVAAVALWPKGRDVDVVTAARAPLTQSVVATGRIATPARISIGSPLAATVLEITVREGDLVAPGQVLARLRSDDAAALIAQAAAALTEAEARFEQTVQVGRPVAAQQLAQAEANLKVAQAEAERARQLVAQGFYARSKADDALRNAANATSAVATARAQLLAQAPGGTEHNATRARVEQARAQLAPAAGTVLTRKAEPGDVASAGKVLLEIADAGETRIHATVDEKNLRLLATGQKARGVADAFPNQAFDAELYYLAPAVDPLRGTVEIRFRVARPPAFLRPDMTVSVETVTGHKDSTLVLPAEAVREPASAKPWVLLATDGIARRSDVSLGLAGIGRVEILNGIGEGDQAILPAAGALDGDKVRIREPRKPKIGGIQVPQGFTR